MYSLDEPPPGGRTSRRPAGRVRVPVGAVGPDWGAEARGERGSFVKAFSFYLKTGLIAFSIRESDPDFFMAHWRWINQKEGFWAQQKGMDDMATDRISKPLYKILSELTQESRVEVALPLAIKDLVRLKLKETREQQEAFAQRYGMDFPSFKRAWHAGLIEQQHSYEVERDYWEWEATVTDEERLLEMFESLP